MSTLFAYGVLTRAEILHPLAGRQLTCRPAVLPDFERLTVRKDGYCPFPAVVPRSGMSTPGVVIPDVDDASLARLDAFEEIDQGLFLRRSLPIHDSAGQSLSAEVYVAGPNLVDHLEGPWDAEAFFARHLAIYRDQIIPELLASLTR